MTKIEHSLKSVRNILKKYKPSKVYVVTSKTLASKLDWAIRELGLVKSDLILLPDGEAAKTWDNLQALLKKFSELNLDRSSILIALGGGTVGDIVGFAASIYLRGIRYLQVPTTLLAQADSAHGGKTGIDFLGLKNQLGTYYLPIATILDSRFLKSLSAEQIIDGLGEIIKAGLIKDPSILSILKKHQISDLAASADLVRVIDKSIAVKNYFVSSDSTDKHARQILNFGHTLGHGIELKYRLSHGRAVLIGMILELRLTEKLKLTKPGVGEDFEIFLQTIGIKLNTDMRPEWTTITHDKKVAGQNIAFPVVEYPGQAKMISLRLTTLKKSLQ